MTDGEPRIIEFLMTSDATRPAELPDWMLAPLERDRPDELSHELITAASLLNVRRLHPGIRFHTARTLIAEYAGDPVRLEELSDRIVAFHPACCFERLNPSGGGDVFIDDPFDPEGSASVKLTEAEWRSVNRAPMPRDTLHGPHGFIRNYPAARVHAFSAPKAHLETRSQAVKQTFVWWARQTHT